MYRKRKWNRVPGDTQISVYWADDGGWLYEHNDNPLPKLVQQELRNVPHDSDVVFTIKWLSTGYYDPGISSGPIEKSYPPEGDDERILDGPVVVDIDTKTAKLSNEASMALFDDVEDIVMESEPDDIDTRDVDVWGDRYDESYFNKALDRILLS